MVAASLRCAQVEADQPRVVVMQHHADDPMSPRGLLIAYEEGGRVQPVACA